MYDSFHLLLHGCRAPQKPIGSRGFDWRYTRSWAKNRLNCVAALYLEPGVRDPLWEVVDTCRTTRIRVRQGAVTVRDLVKHRTFILRAGHSYTARAR